MEYGLWEVFNYLSPYDKLNYLIKMISYTAKKE